MIKSFVVSKSRQSTWCDPLSCGCRCYWRSITGGSLRHRAMWKQVPHLLFISRAHSVMTDISGYLSLKTFLAGSPSRRNSQVASFFSFAFAISPIRSFTLGLSVSTVLVSSAIETKYLAMTANANRCNHLSLSITGYLVASDRNSGNP